ncbi:MAG TPA: Ig-like domain-containing protein [Pyrinomonadaceae bacterium]
MERRRRARGLRACAAAALCLLALAAVQPPADAQQRRPAPAPAPSAKDGPVSVTYGQLFKEGKTEFDDIDPATIGPLPKGYEAFGKSAYKIKTEAVAVGPHAVEFSFPSVADRAAFESLRVLHAEWDKVDEKFFWVDCAFLEEDGFKSDFNARTLTARVKYLGAFAVARLVGPFDTKMKSADLSVEIVAPEGRINGNTDAHYEIKVTNRGPDDAADIRLNGAGFSSNQFVSASAPERGNGRCRQDGSNYGCKLDLLAKGETAVFRIVLNPRENPRARTPDEGEDFNLDATAYSRVADDKNFEDNHAESWIKVYPDPNRAPAVDLLSPKQDDLFTATDEIMLSARATDPEGGVAKVLFYDGDKLIGEGIQAGKDEYRLGWTGARPGPHIVTVIVTDTGGRSDYETRGTTVNGPLTVRVEGPADGAVLKTKMRLKGDRVEVDPVKWEAVAGVGGQRIKKVTFYLQGGEMPGFGVPAGVEGRAAGVDRATGETRYAATLEGFNPGPYRLMVVAADEDGFETVSRPVSLRVSAAAPVRLSARPAERAPGQPAAYVIDAHSVFNSSLDSSAGRGGRVDFYADGKLIGTARIDGFIGFAQFVWTDAPPGAHELTAVATYDDGLASDPSPPLRLTVGKEGKKTVDSRQ